MRSRPKPNRNNLKMFPEDRRQRQAALLLHFLAAKFSLLTFQSTSKSVRSDRNRLAARQIRDLAPAGETQRTLAITLSGTSR